MKCRRALGLILILTLIVLPATWSAEPNLADQVETLARRVRIHNYDTYRLRRSELDRRQEILLRAVTGWRERGASDAEAAELLAWLETALDASQSSLSSYAPRQRAAATAPPVLEAGPAPVAPQRSPAEVRHLVPAAPSNRARSAATVPSSPHQPQRRPAAPAERTEPAPAVVAPPQRSPDGHRNGYTAPTPIVPQVETELETVQPQPAPAEPVPQATARPKVQLQPQPPSEPLEIEDDAAQPPAQAVPHSADRPPRRELASAPPSMTIGPPSREANTAPFDVTGRATSPPALAVPKTADSARGRELPSAPPPVTVTPPAASPPAAQTNTDPIRINLTVLSTKVQAFNEGLIELEDQLSLDGTWDLLRLQTVADDFAALDSARNHLLLYLETLSPEDRHKMPQLADPAVALARFTQRMFEVRVQYSEKSRQGDHSLPLDWQDHMDRIQSIVRTWMVENRD